VPQAERFKITADAYQIIGKIPADVYQRIGDNQPSVVLS
jgi:hypothetical protein